MSPEVEYYMKDTKCNRCLLRIYTFLLFLICIGFIISTLIFIINYDKIFKYEEEYLKLTRG